MKSIVPLPGPISVSTFYDQLAPFYHLLFPDWDASIRRQGEQLAALIALEWPGAQRVLDVSCGIGTQAIGLAWRGLSVSASDLSPTEVDRARREAAVRGADIAFSVCDMRQAHAHHGGGFDVVLSADNSLPHLLSDDELRGALRQMFDCARPGGGCLVTVRDYEREPRGRHLVKPYAVRVEGGKRYVPLQVWDFDEADKPDKADDGSDDRGAHYDLLFAIVEEDLASGQVRTHAMRSRYYAVSTDTLCRLMCEAGFMQVRRIDGAFYQPVLIGHRPG